MTVSVSDVAWTETLEEIGGLCEDCVEGPGGGDGTWGGGAVLVVVFCSVTVVGCGPNFFKIGWNKTIARKVSAKTSRSRRSVPGSC